MEVIVRVKLSECILSQFLRGRATFFRASLSLIFAHHFPLFLGFAALLVSLVSLVRLVKLVSFNARITPYKPVGIVLTESYLILLYLTYRNFAGTQLPNLQPKHFKVISSFFSYLFFHIQHSNGVKWSETMSFAFFFLVAVTFSLRYFTCRYQSTLSSRAHLRV